MNRNGPGPICRTNRLMSQRVYIDFFKRLFTAAYTRMIIYLGIGFLRLTMILNTLVEKRNLSSTGA